MMIIFLSIYCLTIQFSNAMIKCLDDYNKPVDWIIAYKLPALKSVKNINHRGTFYMYMTSSNYSDWIPSNFGIDSSHSFLKNTLSSYYEKENVSFIFYNDETPENGTNSVKGHTKGIVLANNESGLWIIHSVPKFPFINEYKFPETGMKFGQSFICISLDLKNVDEVGKQLKYNEPNIFSHHIDKDLGNKLPNLASAAANNTVTTSPWYRQTTITTSGKFDLYSFAKSKKFAKDLYADWVAPVLQCNLLVETWPNGPGRLNSDCTKPFKVMNIKSILVSPEHTTFNSTHDHSKWAISEVNDWICIGDINRAKHQEARGGGTVCFQNEVIKMNFNKLVKCVEECENNDVLIYNY